jgi:hypothetical protein
MNISKKRSANGTIVDEAAFPQEPQIENDKEMLDRETLIQDKDAGFRRKNRTFSSASLEAIADKMEWGHFDPHVEWPPEPAIVRTSSKENSGIGSKTPQGSTS